jgi:hypothetical protein
LGAYGSAVIIALQYIRCLCHKCQENIISIVIEHHIRLPHLFSDKGRLLLNGRPFWLRSANHFQSIGATQYREGVLASEMILLVASQDPIAGRFPGDLIALSVDD